jgi:biopolymer transport protein ExbD
MASTAHHDDDLITGINVTPLVDITLVLLVILMVTASYVVSRSIPLELPRAGSGEATPTTLLVSIDRQGQLFLDAEPVADEVLRERVRQAAAASEDVRAIIAADGRVAHAQVVHVIDLLRLEKVTRFSFDVDPEALARRTP